MPRSIAGRLLFWFLVIALIPCAILTATTARIATRALENSVRRNLNQIAAAKANELETYAHERIGDAATLGRSPDVAGAIRSLSEARRSATVGSPAAPAPAEVTSFLDFAARSSGYSQLLLVDDAGTVLFSLEDSPAVGASLVEGQLAESELAHGYNQARFLLLSDMTGFQAYGVAQRPLAFVVSPVFDAGRVIGVLALGLGPESLWHILDDWSGLGETGEIMAAERNGDDVVITTPLRHAPDAAFRLRIPLESPRGQAVLRATRGERGNGTGLDYRGENVAAAWCYLPRDSLPR